MKVVGHLLHLLFVGAILPSGFLLGIVCFYAHSEGIISTTLSLSQANAALAQAGGMVGNVFAVGDNRYLVKRSRIVDKKSPNVFIGEIEITPLPRHASQ